MDSPEFNDPPGRHALQRLAPPSLADKAKRGVWQIFYYLLFRFTPVPMHGWRRMLLRMFGAKVGPRAAIYPSANIWAPWNLTVGSNVTVGPGAELYNVAQVTLGDDVIMSQRAFLCSASHDLRSAHFTLLAGPINILPSAWVAAEAFIAPGITIGEFAVVGARAVVTHDVAAHAIVTGNPAKLSGNRPAEARNVLGTK